MNNDINILKQLAIISGVLAAKTDGPNSVALEVYPDESGIVSHVVFDEDDHSPDRVKGLFSWKTEEEFYERLQFCVSTIDTTNTRILA